MTRGCIVVLLCALASLAGGAQEVPSVARQPKDGPPIPGVGPWRPLQRFILVRLEQPIARARTLAADEPWRLQLPAVSAWQRLTPYLERALRARAVVRADDRFSTLRVGPLTRVGDTATITLAVGGIFRCPGETREREWSSFETVHTVRSPSGAWSPARSSRRGDGHSEPCPPRGDTWDGIELAAARHLLALHPGEVVVIDSAYAEADRAPGHPSGTYRPTGRTAQLAAALRARVGAAVPDHGVHLLLSKPAVAGDSARVTVTVRWSAGPGWRAGRSGYHTQTQVLVRDGGLWRVARVVELGIT